MKKYLFFFLLMSLLVCKVNAKEIEVGFSDGNIINLDDSSDYESEEFKYFSKENKIILNNANLKYIIINGSIREELLFELIGDSYIVNDSGFGIENYNSDLILEGTGKLYITTDQASAVYMEESNIYMRTNGYFESKVTNTINIKNGELIIEKNADLKVKSDGAQAIYIQPGLLEVNNAKLNVISSSDPIAILNRFKPYYFFNSKIKTENVKQKNSVYGVYNKYTIGYIHDIEIIPDTIENTTLRTYELKLGNIINGQINLNKSEYLYGERIDYEIVSDRGYIYKENSVNFLEDFSLTNENSQVRMLDIGLTISCEFEPKQSYNVNLYYNEGGTFDKDDVTIVYENEDYLLNIETNDGYNIKNITINDNTIENNNIIKLSNITTDYDIVIEFESNSSNKQLVEENDENNNQSKIEEMIVNPKTNDEIKIYEILLLFSLIIFSIPVFFQIKSSNIK